MKIAVIVMFSLIALGFIADAMSRAKLRRLRESGVYPPEGQGTDAHIDRLIHLGMRIHAIKLYKEVHGGDLKSARIAVDERIEAQHGAGG